MQFCGLIILTDKKYRQEIAAAKAAQQKLNNKLIQSLLHNAEQYWIVAKGLLGREVKLLRRHH